MTQEDKNILLKDLCARLPYYTELYSNVADGNWAILTPVVISNLMNATEDLILKPYLRPMSSMTEEEEKELKSTLPFSISFSWDVNNEFIIYTDSEYDGDHYFSCFVDIQDWHNAHHFDYRNLIEKGLALEAPEDMYKEK